VKLVDGSESVTNTDFNKERQLCLELAAKLGWNSQLGVIQFGGKAQIITPLTVNKEDLEKKVEGTIHYVVKVCLRRIGMTKLSGITNLGVAMEICNAEFNRSK
jgi:hypothetical protein